MDARAARRCRADPDDITSCVGRGTGDVFLQTAPERHCQRQTGVKQTNDRHGRSGGPVRERLRPRLLLRGSQAR